MIRKILTAVTCLFAVGAHAQTAPITGATCVSTGTVVVNVTIVVTGGVFDGGCKTYVPGPAMGFNIGDETSAARSVLFHVRNGATLRNVILGRPVQINASQAKAIYVFDGATLENIDITRVEGETAISIRNTSTVNITKLTSGTAPFVERHILAVGANTRVTVSNCIFKRAQRVFRQSGATVYPTSVSIDRCDISDIEDAVFRTDGPQSTAKLTNSRLHNVNQVCRGYAPGNCITAGNVTY